MPEKPKLRRKQYFIRKDYQFKFILKFCLIVLAGSIISTAILFFFAQGTLTSSFEHSRLVIRNTATAIMPAVILTNVITLIVITFATIVVVLFISHKIAGPMFRFEKDLKDIGQGDLTKKVSLRKKDQFTNLGDSLNIMTATLHEKVVSTQAEVEQLIELASKEKAPQKLVEGLNHLHKSLNQHFRI
jgi:methyl-accepting chemotaxis protein